MEFTNILLLSQIAGYVIALILAFCVTVPMIMHHNQFKGHCLLFSTGEWKEEDGQFDVNWASNIYCNFNIVLSLFIIIVSSFQIFRLSRFAYLRKDSSFLSAFIDVIVNIWMSALTVIGASIITFGFVTWCQYMTERFPTCQIADGRDIDKKDGINTTGFYIELGTAQFGIWGSFACWVGLSVFAVIKLCHYHQLENIRVSMYIERQRLMNSGVSYPNETTPPSIAVNEQNQNTK